MIAMEPTHEICHMGCVLYRVCSVQGVFCTACVLYRVCTVQCVMVLWVVKLILKIVLFQNTMVVLLSLWYSSVSTFTMSAAASRCCSLSTGVVCCGQPQGGTACLQG